MTREEAMALVAKAIRSGVYNDLGSGSNVDLCVITKDKVDYLRNHEVLFDKTYARWVAGALQWLRNSCNGSAQRLGAVPHGFAMVGLHALFPYAEDPRCASSYNRLHTALHAVAACCPLADATTQTCLRHVMLPCRKYPVTYAPGTTPVVKERIISLKEVAVVEGEAMDTS